jgi:hypothetical protein
MRAANAAPCFGSATRSCEPVITIVGVPDSSPNRFSALYDRAAAACLKAKIG